MIVASCSVAMRWLSGASASGWVLRSALACPVDSMHLIAFDHLTLLPCSQLGSAVNQF